jgi:hypothetical protein
MKYTYTSTTYYLFALVLEQQTTALLKHQTNLENIKYNIVDFTFKVTLQYY